MENTSPVLIKANSIFKKEIALRIKGCLYKLIFIFFYFIICLPNIYSEGTKEFSPTSNDWVLLYLSDGFANYGTHATSQSMCFEVLDPSEEVYIALSQIVYGNFRDISPQPYDFRIVNSSGTVVHGPFTITPANANGNNYADVVAGPNLGGGGYDVSNPAYHFSPSSAGTYCVEFSIPATYTVMIDPFNSIIYANQGPYRFDVTVTDAGGAAQLGRLFSENWNLRTPCTGCTDVFSQPFNGMVYVLTDLGFVHEVDFDNSGFRGLTFALAFNESGPGSTMNVLADRRSVDGSNATNPQYKIFLNDPDLALYTEAVLGTVVSGPEVVGNGQCDPSGNFCLDFEIDQPGLVEVILDFDGDDGIYTSGTADRIFALRVGPSDPKTQCIAWDKKDGLGVDVDPVADIPLFIRYSQGEIHFMKHDVEYNNPGFTTSVIHPTGGITSNVYYYDDSALNTSDNDANLDSDANPATGTNPPLVELNGCPAPCHLWNRNLSSTTNGYGEGNTINTWWTGHVVLTPVVNQRLCYVDDLQITKNVLAFGSSVSGDPSNFDVTFEILMENAGSTTLTDLTLTDDLVANMGVAFISMVTPPTISTNTGSPVLPNPSASFPTQFFDGSSGTLNPGDVISVTFTIEVDPDAAGAPNPVVNQASGGGTNEFSNSETSNSNTQEFTQDSFQDSDMDGIVNEDDIDDDNDGILDTDECSIANRVQYVDFDGWMPGETVRSVYYPGGGTLNVNTVLSYTRNGAPMTYVHENSGLGAFPRAFEGLSLADNYTGAVFTAEYDGVEGVLTASHALNLLRQLLPQQDGTYEHELEVDYTSTTLGTTDPGTIVAIGGFYPDALGWDNEITISAILPGGALETDYSGWTALLSDVNTAQPGGGTFSTPWESATFTANGVVLDPEDNPPGYSGFQDVRWGQVQTPSDKFYEKIIIKRKLIAAAGYYDYEYWAFALGYEYSVFDCDVDEDGIPNPFDLDSDGDGCADALEAGHGETMQADSTIAGPYGNNGLDENVESDDLQTATVTYSLENAFLDSLTQSLFCPCDDPTLVAANCDYDGDGILNADDIDDDNDGILDVDECAQVNYLHNSSMESYNTCPNFSTGATIDYCDGWASSNYNGQLMVNDPANCVSNKPGTPWLASTALPYGSNGLAWLGIHSVSTTDGEAATNTLALPMPIGLNYTLSFDAGYVVNSPYTVGGILRVNGVKSDNSKVIIGDFNITNVMTDVNPDWQPYSLNFTTADVYEKVEFMALSTGGPNSYMYFDNLKIVSDAPVFCDPDGDLISNEFDLDSDGDGCADAYEAGHGQAVQADSTIAGPFGNNGYDENIESDDTQAATATYTFEDNGSGTPAFLDNLTFGADCPFPPEECGNGIDDDMDGLIDCDDPDVFFDPSLPDNDGDGIPDCCDNCTDDRDGDGIVDCEDIDPMGWIYYEHTGEIVSGVAVSVVEVGSGSSANVNLIQDGSTGMYQWIVNTPGTYQMTLNLPSGWTTSNGCLQQDPPAYDPTGMTDPVDLGNGQNGTTGFLTSNACTPYYLTFDLEVGDPLVINNNIPLIPTTEISCDDGIDNDEDGLIDCDDPDCQPAITLIGDCTGLAVLNPQSDWVFQWLRDGNPIAGATSSFYVPSPAVYGEYSVEVTNQYSCVTISSGVIACCNPTMPGVGGN